MLRELLLPLVKYFSPFNIFRYLTFRSAYAAVTAPPHCLSFRALCHREAQSVEIRAIGEDRWPPDSSGEDRYSDDGSILIIAAVAVSVVLWQRCAKSPHLDRAFFADRFGAIGGRG